MANENTKASRRLCLVACLSLLASCTSIAPAPEAASTDQHFTCVAPGGVCKPVLRLAIDPSFAADQRDELAVGALDWTRYGQRVELVAWGAPGMVPLCAGDPGWDGKEGIAGPRVCGYQVGIMIRADVPAWYARQIATHEVGHLLGSTDHLPADELGIMSGGEIAFVITDADIQWMCERSDVCPLP